MSARPISYTVLIDDRPPSEALLRSIRSIEVEQDVAKAAMVRLTLAIAVNERGSGWVTVDDDAFESMTKVSILVSAKPPRPRPLINAYVIDIKPNISPTPGESTVEIVAMDAQRMMRSKERIAPRGNQADSVIAEQILSGAGLRTDVERTSSQRDEAMTTTMQSSTDGALLDVLAERNGYEFYIEPGLPPFVPDTGHFHRPRLDDEPQGTLMVNLGVESNATDFAVQDDRQAAAAISARGVDPRTLRPVAVSLSKTTAPVLGALAFDTKPETSRLIETGGIWEPGELATFVQGRIDQSNWAVTATGSATMTRYGDVIRIGAPIYVRGAGKLNSGTYYVTAVTYLLAPGEITQRFTLKRNARKPDGTERFAL
jgi:hypothetical protein